VNCTVEREDLEAALSELAAEIAEPAAGIYGPGTMAWEIGRESALFLGGGKAALLQLAHPLVAQAIDRYSRTRSDPVGRFKRTFDGVYRMVFGDLDQAFAASRRVHAIHARVAANDPEALLWVYATLVATAIEVFDLIVGPLTYQEKDRYFAESRRFARLFGIPARLLPRDFAEFSRYYAAALAGPMIEVVPAARETASFLFAPRSIEAPAVRWARLFTAGLLPERLRAAYGLPYSRLERLAFHASVAGLRAAYPRLPGSVRFLPAYRAACRRLRLPPGAESVRRSASPAP
jgi:uncharacterized protein (DUF2236 family)